MTTIPLLHEAAIRAELGEGMDAEVLAGRDRCGLWPAPASRS
ncbi:MAG: hypothetical protein ACNA8R_09890 [Nitriliruptoraceae bacterium]